MSDEMHEETPAYGKAKGGRSRAEVLPASRRKEIAEKAAAARWQEVPEAVCGSPDRPLIVGNAAIGCYVLQDGTRVLSQGDFLGALGRARTVRRTTGIPPIVQGRALEPFLPDGLVDKAQAIPFRTPTGQKVLGYNAEILPDVCEAFLAARAAGVLPRNQQHIAEQAEILVRGLSRVGIIALVDEATGYQDVRTKDALAKILEEFIAKEIQPYLVTFPPEFYKEMFRLRGLEYRADGMRPQYFGRLTNNIVYDRLAPGVLTELKAVQEKGATGKPKHKLFQRLTGNQGYPKLREHLGSVVTLMKISTTWDEFYAHLERLHPKYSSHPMLDFSGKQTV